MMVKIEPSRIQSLRYHESQGISYVERRRGMATNGITDTKTLCLMEMGMRKLVVDESGVEPLVRRGGIGDCSSGVAGSDNRRG